MVKYQVFLSFRGPETYNNLAKYLHYRLTSAGVRTFLDREEIQFGQNISNELINAIRNSAICVPIFSPDFASSAACLMEVAEMVKSGKEIRPIFFFVKPCHVRHQQGTYATSFAEHEHKKHYAGPTIQEWRNALKAIADKSGLEFKNTALETALKKTGARNGRKIRKAGLEAALAETGGPFYKDLFDGFRDLDVFITNIWRMAQEDVTRNLVGIDADVAEMMRKLGFYYQKGVVKQLAMTGRRVLVVWGMPLVGKTSLAKVVFHKIKHLFQGHSLLENVRHEFAQNNVVSLQSKLIRELKGGGVFPEVTSSDNGTTTIQNSFGQNRVLILLDDVDGADQFKQIKTLAGELSWFGEGSAIILTTIKRDVIRFYDNQSQEQNKGNVFNYHVAPMNEDHALELFYRHAFPLHHPPEDYKRRSKEITSAVGRLPPAIESVGRYLCGKGDDHWAETLKSLKSGPQEKVGLILKKHLNGLPQKARNIFLDIACFFAGVEKTMPRVEKTIHNYMWAALKWDPLWSVGCLENMAFLIKGEENEFSMHNQLKLLGREIVEDESRDSPWGRSRLWDYKDVRKTLNQKKVTKKVKALRVASNFNKVDGEKFCNLPWLKFLELDEVDIEGNPNDILPNLIWLDWRGRPKESSGGPQKSKLLEFNMKKLVILKLSSIPDKLTLDEWDQLMQKAGSLQVLILKSCTWVNASMEIPASKLLECLILEGCLHLELKTTKSKFEKLVSFSIKGCKRVKDLPEALRFMKALKELLIDGSGIEKLHFEEGSLPVLETLSACGCVALRQVTDSIGLLKNLKKLFLRGCRDLYELPPVFGELGQLQEMDLSDTTISELPPCVEHCKKLQVLKMAPTFVEEFPVAIKNLKELKELDFTDCGGLSGRCDITGLSSLRILRLKGTEISEVLARDEAQFCLQILELDDGVDKLIPIGPDEYWCLPA